MYLENERTCADRKGVEERRREMKIVTFVFVCKSVVRGWDDVGTFLVKKATKWKKQISSNNTNNDVDTREWNEILRLLRKLCWRYFFQSKKLNQSVEFSKRATLPSSIFFAIFIWQDTIQGLIATSPIRRPLKVRPWQERRLSRRMLTRFHTMLLTYVDVVLFLWILHQFDSFKWKYKKISGWITYRQMIIRLSETDFVAVHPHLL